MFVPRVLFASAFPIHRLGAELRVSVWAPPAEYEDLVTTTWEDLRAHAKQPIWDGTYYRVLNPFALENGFGVLSLRLGTIQYRYVSTYPALHQHHARLQLEPLYHLSTIALLRTSDDYYLFGRRTRNGEMDLIGGGVQSDELAISCGADLERNLRKEFHEEAGIRSADIAQLTGIGILLSGTSNVLIVGYAILSLTKAAATARFALRTENEMSEPVFITQNELGPALRSLGDYRPLIPELIQPLPALGLQ
jgi:8-oxo-dGTP pyrophosphatase MutT (NUDIX family)